MLEPEPAPQRAAGHTNRPALVAELRLVAELEPHPTPPATVAPGHRPIAIEVLPQKERPQARPNRRQPQGPALVRPKPRLRPQGALVQTPAHHPTPAVAVVAVVAVVVAGVGGVVVAELCPIAIGVRQRPEHPPSLRHPAGQRPSRSYLRRWCAYAGCSRPPVPIRALERDNGIIIREMAFFIVVGGKTTGRLARQLGSPGTVLPGTYSCS